MLLALLFSFIAHATVTVESGCALRTSPFAPFRIADMNGDRTTIDLKNGSTPGYIPRNSIVQIDAESVRDFVPGTMVSVKVLAVADTEKTHLNLKSGGVERAGVADAQRARVGDQGQVASSNLVPFVGSLQVPGSMIDANREVFVVRKDSPFLKLPELAGHAVRLSQIGPLYRNKKCCPAGVDPGSGLEMSKDPRCTYAPIFETMKNAGGPYDVRLVHDDEFAPPADGCFVASLQPVAKQSYNEIFGAVGQLAKYSSDALTRIQKVAFDNATAPRCREGRASCRHRVSGNRSKGSCRQAVREDLEELGYLHEHPPGMNASQLSPWLSDHGFTNVMDQVRTSANAPPGAILVYRAPGGRAGHVEIKVDETNYCSDFCTDHPIDQSNLDRELIGVYVPNGAS